MTKRKYDDTYIVDCILEQCQEVIEDFNYKDDFDESSPHFGLAHLDVTQAYFVALDLMKFIDETRKENHE